MKSVSPRPRCARTLPRSSVAPVVVTIEALCVLASHAPIAPGRRASFRFDL
jgi:hypothetical protein